MGGVGPQIFRRKKSGTRTLLFDGVSISRTAVPLLCHSSLQGWPAEQQNEVDYFRAEDKYTSVVSRDREWVIRPLAHLQPPQRSGRGTEGLRHGFQQPGKIGGGVESRACRRETVLRRRSSLTGFRS